MSNGDNSGCFRGGSEWPYFGQLSSPVGCWPGRILADNATPFCNVSRAKIYVGVHSVIMLKFMIGKCEQYNKMYLFQGKRNEM